MSVRRNIFISPFKRKVKVLYPPTPLVVKTAESWNLEILLPRRLQKKSWRIYNEKIVNSVKQLKSVARMVGLKLNSEYKSLLIILKVMDNLIKG